jgi:transposase
LDTLNPATAGEARRSTIMARKTYSEEFRRQAVELYRSTPGATLRGIAIDLGITRGTLTCGCPKPAHMSCDVLIFVEEAADAVAPADLVGPCWRAAGEWS